MKNIRGDLELMHLREILTWVETARKSGTLRISCEEVEKKLYFQEGKLIFITSNSKGEQFSEVLAALGHLEPDQITAAVSAARQGEIPFTSYLLTQRILDRASLERVLSYTVTKAIAAALGWKGGNFQFIDMLPPTVINGPVQLDIAQALTQVDELLAEDRARCPEKDREIVKSLAKGLAEGDFDIPPMPAIIQKLNEVMSDEDATAHDLMKLIMGDQILTVKILKVVNSSFYSLPNQVSSLQHAIAFVGFKSILNIVTAHTLSNISAKNTVEIRAILRHSLLCAYAAQRISATAGFDEEVAFVCGLLHDIGKTVLLNMLADYDLPQQDKELLIDKYHAQAGGLLTVKWNLPEVVQTAVKFHHHPDQAPFEKLAAEIVWFANGLVLDPDHVDDLKAACLQLDPARIDTESLLDGLKEIEETVDNFL